MYKKQELYCREMQLKPEMHWVGQLPCFFLNQVCLLLLDKVKNSTITAYIV